MLEQSSGKESVSDCKMIDHENAVANEHDQRRYCDLSQTEIQANIGTDGIIVIAPLLRPERPGESDRLE
jgi:hypothetical protein